MTWKWNTAPLGCEDKCSKCQQPLRRERDGGIVIWTDSKQYHIACLLDRLAASPDPLSHATTTAVCPTGACAMTPILPRQPKSD